MRYAELLQDILQKVNVVKLRIGQNLGQQLRSFAGLLLQAGGDGAEIHPAVLWIGAVEHRGGEAHPAQGVLDGQGQGTAAVFLCGHAAQNPAQYRQGGQVLRGQIGGLEVGAEIGNGAAHGVLHEGDALENGLRHLQGFRLFGEVAELQHGDGFQGFLTVGGLLPELQGLPFRLQPRLVRLRPDFAFLMEPGRLLLPPLGGQRLGGYHYQGDGMFIFQEKLPNEGFEPTCLQLFFQLLQRVLHHKGRRRVAAV